MENEKRKPHHFQPKPKAETPLGQLPTAFHGCQHCHGSKTIQAPSYPGFEGKPTIPVPCPYCK